MDISSLTQQPKQAASSPPPDVAKAAAGAAVGDTTAAAGTADAPATTHRLSRGGLFLRLMQTYEDKHPDEAKAFLNGVAEKLRSDAERAGPFAPRLNYWADKFEMAAESGDMSKLLPTFRPHDHFGMRAYQRASEPPAADASELDAVVAGDLSDLPETSEAESSTDAAQLTAAESEAAAAPARGDATAAAATLAAAEPNAATTLTAAQADRNAATPTAAETSAATSLTAAADLAAASTTPDADALLGQAASANRAANVTDAIANPTTPPILATDALMARAVDDASAVQANVLRETAVAQLNILKDAAIEQLNVLREASLMQSVLPPGSAVSQRANETANAASADVRDAKPASARAEPTRV